MTIIIGWLVLLGYLVNEGYTIIAQIVFWSFILLLILLGIDERAEREKARANVQYYWAHYYDEDQVEARKRMMRPEPVPYDDFEDWNLPH